MTVAPTKEESKTKPETPGTAPAPPAKPPLTLAELEAKNQAMLEDLGYKRPTKEKAKSEPEGTTAPAAQPATAQTPATPAETAKPAEATPEEEEEKPKRRKPYAERVADKISERVTATLDAIKPPEASPSTAPQLTPKDIRDRRILEVMAEQPAYKGIVEQFDKFVPAETEYIKKWEAANPETEFDPEAEEHAAFYKKHQPQFEDDDFDDARSELTKREAKAEWKREQEQERLVQDAVRNVEQTQKSVAEELITALDPKAEAKTLSEVEKKDGVLFDLIEDKLPLLQNLASVNALLLNPKLGYKFDPNNPVHNEWAKRLAQYEQELLAKPVKELKKEGRDFVTLSEWDTLSDSEKRQAWTLLEGDEMKNLLVAEFSNKLKPKLARARVSSNGTASQHSPAAPDAKPADAAAPVGENRKSPSMPDAGDRVPINGVNEKTRSFAFGDLYPGR